MTKEKAKSAAEAWGEFRFSVIGALLSAPPGAGELKRALVELSHKTWRHPITGKPTKFGLSTIERWYYAARREKRSPVKRLERKVRADRGTSRGMDEEAIEILRQQYTEHPSWSRQLHADNLAVVLKERGVTAPHYATICRFMQRIGMVRRRQRTDRAGYRKALSRLESFEVRSFESEYVGSLFHLDFHHCSRQILSSRGEWVTPRCLTVMDDCSRLVCHLQWYLAEGAEDLVHGVIQALLKVGLPRALMSDNGSAMTSVEFTQGLTRLGIIHATTLPYSPYQNGKQERFFGTLEGRLVAMLEGVKDLTLQKLNEASHAWVEIEYHREVHRELGASPAKRFVETKDVLRPAPGIDDLRNAFRCRIVRRQRQTDGTVSIDGTRFEIPSRYRTVKEIAIEYATWNLGLVHIVDRVTGNLLCQVYPVDKKRNATAERRRISSEAVPLKPVVECECECECENTRESPLLRKLMEEYAATGAPAYLPKDENEQEKE